MDDSFSLKLCKSLSDRWDVSLREIPYPSNELHVDLLGTSLIHIGAAATGVTDTATDHAPQTEPARQIEEDHGIAVLQTMIERPPVVAIHDPGLAIPLAFNNADPFLARHPFPSRQPEETVEMNNGKVEDLSQSHGHGRLSGAGGTDDQDSS